MNYFNFLQNTAGLGEWVTRFWWLLPLVGIWTVIWKGLALWRAASNRSKVWFVVLLLVNTFGILEILYLYVFGKRNDSVVHAQVS